MEKEIYYRKDQLIKICVYDKEVCTDLQYIPFKKSIFKNKLEHIKELYVGDMTMDQFKKDYPNHFIDNGIIYSRPMVKFTFINGDIIRYRKNTVEECIEIALKYVDENNFIEFK